MSVGSVASVRSDLPLTSDGSTTAENCSDGPQATRLGLLGIMAGMAGILI